MSTQAQPYPVAGDLDFFEIHGVTYELGDVRDLLSALLHTPPTCLVDSLVVAGLLELLRTKGLWLASVRYGYVFGALSGGSVAPHIHRPPLDAFSAWAAPHSLSQDPHFNSPAGTAQPTRDPQLRPSTRSR